MTKRFAFSSLSTLKLYFNATKSALPFLNSFPKYWSTGLSESSDPKWKSNSESSDPKWKSNSRAARSLFASRGVTGISEVLNKHCLCRVSSVTGTGPRLNDPLLSPCADHRSVCWSVLQVFAVLNFLLSSFYENILMNISLLLQLWFSVNGTAFYIYCCLNCMQYRTLCLVHVKLW